MDSVLKILSLNVGMSSTLAGLTNLLRMENIDIVLLQEVKSTEEDIDSLVNSLGFQSRVNNDSDSPTKPGTAVLWRKSVKVQDVISFLTGRIQIVLMESCIVVNIYAPSRVPKTCDHATAGQSPLQAPREPISLSVTKFVF